MPARPRDESKRRLEKAMSRKGKAALGGFRKRRGTGSEPSAQLRREGSTPKKSGGGRKGGKFQKGIEEEKKRKKKHVPACKYSRSIRKGGNRIGRLKPLRS